MPTVDDVMPVVAVCSPERLTSCLNIGQQSEHAFGTAESGGSVGGPAGGVGAGRGVGVGLGVDVRRPVGAGDGLPGRLVGIDDAVGEIVTIGAAVAVGAGCAGVIGSTVGTAAAGRFDPLPPRLAEPVPTPEG